MDYDLIVVKTLERVYKNYYYIIRGVQIISYKGDKEIGTIGLKETLMRIIHSKSLFYWLILKVFDILMANSLFVYETAD